jgi:hypothetical protein
VRFSRRVAALLRRAMALKRRRGTLSDHGYAVLRGKIHAELNRNRVETRSFRSPPYW